jgi:CHAD domain-containing protein
MTISSNTQFIQLITNYHDREADAFQFYLQYSRQTGDPESIHQFRLALKRIRALASLVEYITKGKFDARKSLLPFRKVFKPSGRLRDLQVQDEIITHIEQQESSSYSLIRNHLFRKNDQMLIKLNNQIDKFSSDSCDLFLSQVIDCLKFLEAVDLFSLSIEWVSNNLSQLKELRANIDHPELFHQFRAIQKSSFYIIDMINEAGIYQLSLGTEMSIIKSLAREIGYWHDLHLLTGRIEKLLTNVEGLESSLVDESRSLQISLTSIKQELHAKLKIDLMDEGIFEVHISPAVIT